VSWAYTNLLRNRISVGSAVYHRSLVRPTHKCNTCGKGRHRPSARTQRCGPVMSIASTARCATLAVTVNLFRKRFIMPPCGFQLPMRRTFGDAAASIQSYKRCRYRCGDQRTSKQTNRHTGTKFHTNIHIYTKVHEQATQDRHSVKVVSYSNCCDLCDRYVANSLIN